MVEGWCRVNHESLGECVRIAWGQSDDSFLTKDAYVSGRYQPPYDELPTRDEYVSDRSPGEE